MTFKAFRLVVKEKIEYMTYELAITAFPYHDFRTGLHVGWIISGAMCLLSIIAVAFAVSNIMSIIRSILL